jgi:dienelactone hydrolase
VRDVQVPPDGRQAVIEFAPADALLPGPFDFIVRPLRYGYEQNDAGRLLATDIVASRRVTGVVIREKFWTAKPVLGGCVNKIPISGRTVSGTPYFRYSDTFEVGEDVWAALDPGIVDPNNISKMCALYVIQSKDGAGWGADNSLTHLPVLGGNAAVQKLKVQAGCINMNKVLVWPTAMQPGEYDIVADFGNNTPDASSFVTDAAYDTPLDIIDGYFVAGFRVVEDPGTMADFSYAGNWNYNEAVVTGMGLSGTVSVQDETSHYHNPGGFSTTNISVPMRAHVYFPADAAGVTDPAQISAAQADYPLIVIIHGNGHSYTSYDFLLEHFAKNGFVAASIHLNTGMSGLGRANVFFQHLAVLQAGFGAKLQDNIGIMGHSRGGEAVIKAARLNQQLSLGHSINAVISLAPTDQYGSEVLGGAWAKPYFVLYGSRDGDINGGIWTPGYTVPQTGFALYDRANGAKKSMVFVYRATHNGFVTTNYDASAGDVPDLITPAQQQPITRAYMNAFFRRHLKSEAKWEGMFNGEWQPASVAAGGVRLFIQSQDTSTLTVDNFEGAGPDWQLSSIGGTVSHAATLPVNPDEGILSPVLDAKSPHDSKGLKLRWNNLNDKLTFDIPAAFKDVSAFSMLSFSVAQKVDSADNPVNQAQNLRVILRDGAGNERAVRVSAFAEIPFPDYRWSHALSKSAMNTIRIPLKSYTIVCAGQVQVNLADVVSLTFLFSEKATGEIEIDQIEFTN